jgi:hypothetical protein
VKDKQKKPKGLVMMPAVIMPEGNIPKDMKLPVINFVVLPRIGEKIHFGEPVSGFPAGRYVVRDIVFQPLNPTQIVHRVIIRPLATSTPLVLDEEPQGAVVTAPEAPTGLQEPAEAPPEGSALQAVALPTERLRKGRFEAVDFADLTRDDVFRQAVNGVWQAPHVCLEPPVLVDGLTHGIRAMPVVLVHGDESDPERITGFRTFPAPEGQADA